jgi:hypothetical protein
MSNPSTSFCAFPITVDSTGFFTVRSTLRSAYLSTILETINKTNPAAVEATIVTTIQATVLISYNTTTIKAID